MVLEEGSYGSVSRALGDGSVYHLIPLLLAGSALILLACCVMILVMLCLLSRMYSLIV